MFFCYHFEKIFEDRVDFDNLFENAGIGCEPGTLTEALLLEESLDCAHAHVLRSHLPEHVMVRPRDQVRFTAYTSR